MKRSTRPLVSARCILKHEEPGPVLDVIQAFNVTPGERILLTCRASSDKQALKGSLDDQATELRRAVEEKGGVVVGTVKCVWSGSDPMWLRRVARLAKEKGATILAESTNRLIRNAHYHDRAPRQADLDELVFHTRGARLMTLLSPDADEHLQRSHHRKRGQRCKQNKGGRPRNNTPGYKKDRREKLQCVVRKLRRRGLSLGAIAKRYSIPRSTIQDWTAGL